MSGQAPAVSPLARARLGRAAVVVTLSTAFFVHVFHFGDGLWRTSSLGGWIDSYFINCVLEHCRASLLHLTNPASPPMYFPASHTLGYSCGQVLFVPWYVLLRVLHVRSAACASSISTLA